MSKQYTEAELHGAMHMAVQHAMTQYKGNSDNSLAQDIRARMGAMLSGGYDFADTLHNIYLDYGYPASLSFFNFWNMYRRFGIATRAVELYPEQTWMDSPIVTSKNVGFMRDLSALVGVDDNGTIDKHSVGLWRRMKGLDTRQRVGRYAGMFMRVKDGLTPDKPIAGKLGGLGTLVEMVPLYESQLTVVTTQNDPMAEDFGQPTMYQFSTSVTGNRNEQASATFRIHPSRIVIAAEGSDNGSIYGTPVLECVYNDLMDLRKILGGGAEGFYKNAAQSVIFELKDASNAKANKSLLDQFNTNYDDFAQNRARRAMWTPGMEAKALTSSLISSEPFVRGSLQAVSAGVRTPAALLVGNQEGRLAGDQDTRGFLSEVQARRVGFGTDMVTAVIDWLIMWGVLPSASYSVEWPDAQAPSQAQKLANANLMADVNQKQYLSGGDVAFSGAEVREAAGFEPDDLPDDGDDDLPDETLEDDEDAVR